MILHALTVVLVAVYAAGWLCAGRVLAGHYAWRIHATAKHKSDNRPEPEDWVLGAVWGLLLALAWPAILLVVRAPDRLKSSNEREAERMVRKVNAERLALENERSIKELEK